MPRTTAEIESFVQEMARGLGVKVDPADLPAVVAVFGVLERNAAALMAFDLPESITAASIFRIPAESHE
jgi:hypothetical protein